MNPSSNAASASGPGSGGAGATGAAPSTGGLGGGASSAEGGTGGGGCVPAPEELCDGVDNTCDDVVDEGCTCVPPKEEECYTGDPATKGVGICKAGTRKCTNAGEWSVCEGEVLPQVSDLCNAADDDCDGAVDEELGSTTCGKGNCLVTVENCIAGVSQECEPGQPNPAGETCEGSDDDCDGAVDENCTCQNGQTQVCYAGPPATKNVGTCTDGTQTCVNGQWGECAGDVTPVAETCDGLDNDCDGNEDDNDPEGGASCATGNPGSCGPGIEHCVGGQIQCQQTNQPGQESCNSLDDDCDGAVDENNPGGGGACSTGLQGVCAAGTQTCTGGAVQCVQSASPSAESCDGLDNDCDGSTDEGNPGGGGSCNTGLPGPCSAGTLSCLGGMVSCVQTVQPGVESCNGADDDCNGVVDNGGNACGGACTLTHAPSVACDGADTDACNEGAWQCSGLNAVVCSDTTGNNAETCNSLDDDCDGTVDEGTNACGGACTLGHAPGSGCDGGDTDQCNEGMWSCSGINNVVCSDNTANNVEVCDAIDQDCDGNLAEGPCSLPNANSNCNSSGSCVITGCNNGFAHCDASQANGCELQNSGWSNTAANPENLGTWNADSEGGWPFCSGNGCDSLLSRTGTRGRFFTINAVEDSDCCGWTSLRFDLIVPNTADYDLYITGSGCSYDPNPVQNGNGNKSIVVYCNDECNGDDDSFTANVEVRFASGQDCDAWTLNVYRNEC